MAKDGYNVVNGTAANPAYITRVTSGQNTYLWTRSTTEPRAANGGNNPSLRCVRLPSTLRALYARSSVGNATLTRRSLENCQRTGSPLSGNPAAALRVSWN